MELATRRVQFAGLTPNPDGRLGKWCAASAWVGGCAITTAKRRERCRRTRSAFQEQIAMVRSAVRAHPDSEGEIRANRDAGGWGQRLHCIVDGPEGIVLRTPTILKAGQ